MRAVSRFVIAGSVLAAAGSAYGAYQIIGWIGIGVLGLLIAFIAVQADMDDAAPIGGQQTSTLYASTLHVQELGGHAEQAARSAERASNLKALNFAKAIGAVLALIGLLGFFFAQLPHQSSPH